MTCIPIGLTVTEKEIIDEGLNYIEENGVPSKNWRPHTRKLEIIRDSIEDKLEL